MGASLVIPGASTLYVQWSCRRCGHKGGIAKTTFPITTEWNEPLIRPLLDALKQKLVRVHMKAGCIATMEDFSVAPYVPDGRTLLDRV